MSVVIPTYNRAEWLVEAIESVLAQTIRDLEIIVVDDASEEDVESVVRDLGVDRDLQPNRLRYLRNSRNMGVSVARNRGAFEGRAPIVAFLDSDDLWLPRKLERQLPLIEGRPEVGAVGGGAVFVDEKGEAVSDPVVPPPRVRYEDLAVSSALPGSCSNELVRRSVFEELGGFAPEMRRVQDREFWIRLSRRWEVRCVTEPTVRVRVHQETRPNRSVSDVLRYHRMIHRRIPERSLRRKAVARTWYILAMRHVRGGSPVRAVGCMARSVWAYPGPLDSRSPRIQPALEEALPESSYRTLRAAVRWVRSLLPGSGSRNGAGGGAAGGECERP